MKSEKTFALSRPFFIVLCPLIFALCIIYVPSGFAQAVQSSAAEKDARNRQYLELLNNVNTFALNVVFAKREICNRRFSRFSLIKFVDGK